MINSNTVASINFEAPWMKYNFCKYYLKYVKMEARNFRRTECMAYGLLFFVVGAWNSSGVFQEECRTVCRHEVDIPDISDLEWLSVTHIVLFYNLGVSISIISVTRCPCFGYGKIPPLRRSYPTRRSRVGYERRRGGIFLQTYHSQSIYKINGVTRGVQIMMFRV